MNGLSENQFYPDAKQSRRIVFRMLCILSPLLYAASLALPAVGDEEGALIGLGCLIFPPWVIAIPAWWSNIIIIISYHLLMQNKIFLARSYSLIATELALTMWIQPQGLLIGAVFWTLSQLLVVVAAFLAPSSGRWGEECKKGGERVG